MFDGFLIGFQSTIDDSQILILMSFVQFVVVVVKKMFFNVTNVRFTNMIYRVKETAVKFYPSIKSSLTFG